MAVTYGFVVITIISFAFDIFIIRREISALTLTFWIIANIWGVANKLDVENIARLVGNCNG